MRWKGRCEADEYSGENPTEIFQIFAELLSFFNEAYSHDIQPYVLFYSNVIM